MMAEGGDLSPGAFAGASAAPPPVEAVNVLLPIWGLRYVRQFLEFCLPTLLAPGNLPALAAELPCTFTVMTHVDDEAALRSNPAFRRLEQVCDVEIKLIDDLITDSNHTTTITLAFARAVRETGPAMVRTAFIFLVSDYIVADGSLAAVLARIKGGASGVLAGNFQVVAEDAIPMLRRRLDQGGLEITVKPRDLLKWTLAHLHPATAANIVNFGINHNEHTNRLFWRVDENTLIGRFFLMHMIGIRPEATDFVVGSSCDYSFIPEMCPSNNVVVLTDSDEYLVVEMQPRHHEAKFLRLGPLQPKSLAVSLAEWTTARHRQNVEHTVVYHAADIPARTGDVMAEAEEFIAKVRSELKSEPQPHRNHPYWIGAIAAHQVATGAPVEPQGIAALLGEKWQQPTGILAMLWQVRATLFGQVPDVSLWHPLWPDLHAPAEALKKVVAEGGRVMAVSGQPQVYARWLVGFSTDAISLERDRLLNMALSQYSPLVGAFDACLLMLNESDLKRGDEFLAHIGPLLKPGGQAFMVVMNERGTHGADLDTSIARHADRLTNPGLWVTGTEYVQTSWLRRRVQAWMVRLSRGVTRRPTLYAPLAVVGGGALSLIGLLSNLAARRTMSEPPLGGACSSVFMTFKASAQPIALPLVLQAPRLNVARPRAQDGGYVALPDPRSDAQSQIVDPHRAEAILARYRFAASILRKRHDVCEIGRSDALGVLLLSGEVGRLCVYDSDVTHLDWLRRELGPARTFELREHDILGHSLPRPYDSICSLSGLDDIPPEHEDAFVRHIRDSLSRDYDLALIGCSSMNVGAPAPGHRAYARDGATLKALLEAHFNVVILFSMLGTAIQPGLLEGAGYFVALCCGRKS